ncbi:MAG: hypothetical protein RH862_11860 [Leptospiraceae bacterium]
MGCYLDVCTCKRCPDPDNPAFSIWLILAAPEYTSIRYRAPSDRGTLTLTLGGRTFDLEPMEISDYYYPSIEGTVYRIESASEGLLLDESSFKYSQSARDDVFVQQDQGLESGSCYLMDGEQGVVIEDVCEW